MSKTYEVEMKDGRKFQIEADSPPTEDEINAFLKTAPSSKSSIKKDKGWFGRMVDNISGWMNEPMKSPGSWEWDYPGTPHPERVSEITTRKEALKQQAIPLAAGIGAALGGGALAIPSLESSLIKGRISSAIVPHVLQFLGSTGGELGAKAAFGDSLDRDTISEALKNATLGEGLNIGIRGTRAGRKATQEFVDLINGKIKLKDITNPVTLKMAASIGAKENYGTRGILSGESFIPMQEIMNEAKEKGINLLTSQLNPSSLTSEIESYGRDAVSKRIQEQRVAIGKTLDELRGRKITNRSEVAERSNAILHEGIQNIRNIIRNSEETLIQNLNLESNTYPIGKKKSITINGMIPMNNSIELARRYSKQIRSLTKEKAFNQLEEQFGGLDKIIEDIKGQKRLGITLEGDIDNINSGKASEVLAIIRSIDEKISKMSTTSVNNPILGKLGRLRKSLVNDLQASSNSPETVMDYLDQYIELRNIEKGIGKNVVDPKSARTVDLLRNREEVTLALEDPQKWKQLQRIQGKEASHQYLMEGLSNSAITETGEFSGQGMKEYINKHSSKFAELPFEQRKSIDKLIGVLDAYNNKDLASRAALESNLRMFKELRFILPWILPAAIAGKGMLGAATAGVTRGGILAWHHAAMSKLLLDKNFTDTAAKIISGEIKPAQVRLYKATLQKAIERAGLQKGVNELGRLMDEEN